MSVVLSLFDGIGCGRVALDRAGIEVSKYYASEIDKTAISIMKNNYPDTIHIGDVSKVCGINCYGEEGWTEVLDVDILIGGSPCQGFSVAGKKMNFNDPKSKLFWEFVRIKRETGAKYFLLENVRMKQEWADIISEQLGVGYVVIDSGDFSAQNRVRYYWTNIDFDGKWDRSNATVEDILEDEVDEKYVVEPERTVKIVENEVKRRKVAYIGSDSQANRVYNIHGKSVCLCGDAGGLVAKTGLYAMPTLTPDRVEKRQNGRRFKPPSSKSYTLTAQDKHGILTNNFIRKLTPVECERLQTLPDGYTKGFTDNQRWKALGNCWTVDVVASIFKGMKGGQECR